MSIYDVIENEGLIEVAAIGEYDYSWSEFKVFYQPSSRRFFWQDDSGCSCYNYGDDMNSLADLCDGDKAAAIRAIDAFYPRVSGLSYASTEDEYMNAKRDIRNFKVSV